MSIPTTATATAIPRTFAIPMARDISKEEEKILTKLNDNLSKLSDRIDEIEHEKRSYEGPPTRDEEGAYRESFSRLNSSLARLTEEKTATEEAIKRLWAGTYGKCAGGKHPIPPARLEIYPNANFCVNCASNSKH